MYGCVGGGLSIAIFAISGWPESPAVTAAIPAASAVGAAILVPFGQFLWRLLWQPWHDLQSKVGELAGEDSAMQPAERLIVVLRNYLREGYELDAIRLGGKSYNTFEVEQLDDWTHSIVTCLTEYGTKAHCERFIEAQNEMECGTGFAAHREWAAARVAVLERIVADLDPEPADAQNLSSSYRRPTPKILFRGWISAF